MRLLSYPWPAFIVYCSRSCVGTRIVSVRIIWANLMCPWRTCLHTQSLLYRQVCFAGARKFNAHSFQAVWYHLESRRSGRKKSVVTGEILLEFSLYDPVHATATPERILQKLAGITLANSEVDDDNDIRLTQTDSIDLEEDEEDDEDDEARDGIIGEPEDVKKNETPEKTKKRLRLARLKKKAKQRAYEFSGLSELAGVLFLEITKIIDLPPERNSQYCLDAQAVLIRALLTVPSDKDLFRYGPIRCHFSWQENLQDEGHPA